MNQIAQKLHIAEKEIVKNDDLSMNFKELTKRNASYKDFNNYLFDFCN